MLPVTFTANAALFAKGPTFIVESTVGRSETPTRRPTSTSFLASSTLPRRSAVAPGMAMCSPDVLAASADAWAWPVMRTEAGMAFTLKARS
jgi:hypothetical protein